MYLLDTNHCSQLIDGNQQIVNRLTVLADVPVATCSIVSGELLFMVLRSKYREANLGKVKAFLQDIEILDVDQAVAGYYGDLKAKLMDHFGPKKKAQRDKTTLHQIGFQDNDLWIAAVALRHKFMVVSQDSDFIRMREVIPDLRSESWL